MSRAPRPARASRPAAGRTLPHGAKGRNASPGPAARTHDAAATRAALVDAGTRVFAERGFGGARVGEIARRAGVNKAMINYHFGGKAGLHRAVLTEGFDDFRARLDPVRHAGGTAEERLLRFAEAMAGVAAARPYFFNMILREVVSAGGPGEEAMVDPIMRIAEIDLEILADGIRDGRFREVHPLLAHLSFAGGLIFVFATAPFRERLVARGARIARHLDTAGAKRHASAEAFARHHHDLFTRGLSRGPASPKRTRMPGAEARTKRRSS